MDVENIYLDTSESRDEYTEAIMRTSVSLLMQYFLGIRRLIKELSHLRSWFLFLMPIGWR